MKYKLTKKQKKMRNRIIIAIALLAVTAATLHFVEVPWWAELVLHTVFLLKKPQFLGCGAFD